MADAIILDLEYTAWEGSVEHNWSRPGEHREVVQIAAIRIDQATLSETAIFDRLTRPRINPLLSDYFVSLTAIKNEEVALAAEFSVVYPEFLAFAGHAPVFSWGRDDLVLNENLELYGLTHLPRCPRAINLGKWFYASGFDLRGVNSGNVAKAVGAPFEGRAHNALVDCRSLAAALRHVVSAHGIASRPWQPGGLYSASAAAG